MMNAMKLSEAMKSNKSNKYAVRECIMYLMDIYMHEHINDEGNIEGWLMCGVPDDAGIEEFAEFAEDDEMWLDCLRIFARDVTEDEEG